MDAVILHWVMVVVSTEAGAEGLGLSTWNLSVYFCAKNGFVVLAQPERLQRAFNVLVGFFEPVGLMKNA